MASILTSNTGGLTGTPTASQRLPLAFSKKFLDRLEKLNVTPFTEFNEVYPIQQKTGNKLIVTIYPTLAVSTTPLGEDRTTAQNTGFSTTSLTLTLQFYGNDIGWSTLFDITAADIASETHSRELAKNARETFAQLVADDLNGLTQVAASAPAGKFSDIIAAVRRLKNNKVRGFDSLNDMLVGVIGPYFWEDLSTEQNAAYKDHYQTPSGSEVLAEGQLSKPAGGVQFFISNVNDQSNTNEKEYIWGEGALAMTEIQAGIAGADGRAIGLPNVASLVGYLIPARAELADPYGFSNHAVWRGGPVDFEIADSNRIVVLGVSFT